MADEQQPSEEPEREAPAEPEAAADATPAADASPDAAEPKKKKRKKKDAAEAEAEAAAKDPRLVELRAQFDAGNFARVRELATALSKDGDPAIVDVGRDYLARIGVDGVQIAFLGLCAVAILTIALHYIGH